MPEKMEYNRFAKLFPEIAKFTKSYTIDVKMPHAIFVQMQSGQRLYFVCDAKNETRFTLTSDPEVVDKIRGSGYRWKK